MHFHTPQVLFCILFGLVLLGTLTQLGDGQGARLVQRNPGVALFWLAVEFGLLLWGGFFA